MTPIALLGIPNDENSSYLRGPAQAPAAIRRELFSDAYAQCSESGVDLSAPGRWIDHGDVRFDAGGDPWALIEAAVDRALEPGHRLISLGGDHAVTHPILRAVRRRHRRLTIVHVDAHPDIYDAYQGNPRSHASPFARIMEEGLADRLIQVGLRAIGAEHRAQFRRFGVETVSAAQWTGELRLQVEGPVYLSLDLDALDPAFAPGVSHREPGGATPRQVIDLIHRLEGHLVAADVVEYNPSCDIQGTTALVAAKLVKEIAGILAGGTRAAAHLAA